MWPQVHVLNVGHRLEMVGSKQVLPAVAWIRLMYVLSKDR